MQSKRSPEVTVFSEVAGVGMFVPERVVTNDHFASYLDTSDEWIRDRTGIVERRWAEPNVSCSELAEKACRSALQSAGLEPADIDGIVVATVTPDYVFPSTACVLQRRLGVTKGPAFDVNAVCSGFVYALVTANGLIATGQCSKVLVVGAEIFSRIINPQDRTTCILFGDGAGAVVLSGVDGKTSGGAVKVASGSDSLLRGIYCSELFADGSQGDILCVPHGTASALTAERVAAGDHYLRMAGREVFKLAVRSLVEASEGILARTGFAASDVDWFVSHQANQRILSSMAKLLGAPEDKVLSNVERYGNTSAASVPILLAESAGNGKLKRGDLVLLSAFGGGLTWGTVLLRW